MLWGLLCRGLISGLKKKGGDIFSRSVPELVLIVKSRSILWTGRAEDRNGVNSGQFSVLSDLPGSYRTGVYVHFSQERWSYWCRTILLT